MFARNAISTGVKFARSFSASGVANRKVAVLGAAGGIGQPLALLLNNSDLVSELVCYDVAPVTPGVAADLSHINTPAQVTGFVGDQLEEALVGCEAVVIPAGVPRKPGMTRDDLFNTNAGIVATLSAAIAKSCPNAMVMIISNPVNSTVPIAAEIFKKAGTYDPKRLFGVTTLDLCRARTFVAQSQDWNPRDIVVPVVGGHAGTTIVPLISQVPNVELSDEALAAMVHRIQFGGDEVVQAKAGGGSATLSMAYAGAEFCFKVLRAMNGEKGIVECSFVESDVIPGLPFFSSRVSLGKDGVKKIHGVGPVSDLEQANIDAMTPDLQSQIAKGVAFAKNFKA